MGSNFCVKFQRASLKFNTKIWTHTPHNMHFNVFNFCAWVTISLNCGVISLSETAQEVQQRGNNSHGISSSRDDIISNRLSKHFLHIGICRCQTKTTDIALDNSLTICRYCPFYIENIIVILISLWHHILWQYALAPGPRDNFLCRLGRDFIRD